MKATLHCSCRQHLTTQSFTLETPSISLKIPEVESQEYRFNRGVGYSTCGEVALGHEPLEGPFVQPGTNRADVLVIWVT
jgi:hypothetical protein